MAGKVHLTPSLTAAQQLRDLWVGAPEITFSDPACLPPRLTTLSFFHSRLTRLPPGLGQLTALRWVRVHRAAPHHLPGLGA